MTLGRLVLAWLAVAGWFGAAAALSWLIRSRDPSAIVMAVALRFTRWNVSWTLAEAAGLTLFASLWFDSLGSGGWWLLFALVGFLVGFPGRMRQAVMPTDPVGPLRRLMVGQGLADVARYVVAGAILAWRLS